MYSILFYIALSQGNYYVIALYYIYKNKNLINIKLDLLCYPIQNCKRSIQCNTLLIFRINSDDVGGKH